MATPIDAWPEGLFESIVPKLIAVLEHTQRSDSPVTPQAKQALLQAVRPPVRPTGPVSSSSSTLTRHPPAQTTDFKTTLAHAKDYAARLPGGETNLDEQNELIAMLEDLREHKKCVVQGRVCRAHLLSLDSSSFSSQSGSRACSMPAGRARTSRSTPWLPPPRHRRAGHTQPRKLCTVQEIVAVVSQVTSADRSWRDDHESRYWPQGYARVGKVNSARLLGSPRTLNHAIHAMGPSSAEEPRAAKALRLLADGGSLTDVYKAGFSGRVSSQLSHQLSDDQTVLSKELCQSGNRLHEV